MIGLNKRCRLARSVALGLTIAVAAAPMSACFADPAPAALPAPAATGVPGIHTIALFPAANDAGASGAVAAAALDKAVEFRLNSSGVYQTTEFSTLLPAVQRAMNLVGNGIALTSADVALPITSPASAQKIAHVMDTNGFLMEEVDSYTENSATNDVSLTVSGSLYSTESGAAVRTFAVTGTANQTTPGEGASSVMQAAVNSAAAQVVESLGAPAQGTAVLPNSHISAARNTAGTGILIVLAVALAGIIAHSVSSHGNSGSSTSTGTTVAGVGTGSPSGPPAPP